jgi:hypothetical protein
MKKTSRNDITGDFIHSKPSSDMFEKNWELIFGKKKALTDTELKLVEYELNKSSGEVQKKED